MKEWIKPTNTKFFNHYRAFSQLKTVSWNVGNVKNINVGDIVYIYSALQDGKITHQCLVEKIGVTKEHIIDDDIFVVNKSFDNNYKSDKNYINLRVLQITDSEDLKLKHLIKNGLPAAPRSLQSIPAELSNYIDVILS